MIKLIYKGFSVLFLLVFFVAIFFEFPNYLVELNENLGLPCWKNEVGKFVGAFLMALGILTWVYCLLVFAADGEGPAAPIVSPKRLFVEGIYRYSRNPIYVSVIAILLGIFLVKGHLLLLAHVLLSWIVFHLYIILKEEPFLRRRFGEEYEHYLRSVPRWLPIWPKFLKNQNK